LVGMMISTWSSVKAMKPRSCSNGLPAGKGYGVASAHDLERTRLQVDEDKQQPILSRG
jgi:hypothetical protein